MCKVTTTIKNGEEQEISEDIEYFCKNMTEQDETKSYKNYNKETTNFRTLKPAECEKFGLTKKPETGKKVGKTKKSNEITVEFLESISPDEKECMVFNANFMMYHPDLNTGNKSLNEERYPKGRARLFRDARCYGNWNIDSTDGNSNFTDIQINFKSKKLANTMGLTWNKNISKGHQNDLSCAMRGIIKLITSELNGNTSTPANQKLYEIAIQNGINVPFARMPTIVKDPKPLPQPPISTPAPQPHIKPTIVPTIVPTLVPTLVPISVTKPEPKPSVNPTPAPQLPVNEVPVPQPPIEPAAAAASQIQKLNPQLKNLPKNKIKL